MRKVGNKKILRDILSKTRHSEFSPDMAYIIIYAFLYKFCSDSVKNHILSVIAEKEITLDEAFRDEDMVSSFKYDADNMYGFFIGEPDFFIDEVINAKYSDRFFIYEFFNAFSGHVEFPEGSNYEKYFRFIFDAVSSEVNLNKFEFEGENHLIAKEIIYSISKLDILETECSYETVFNEISKSRIIGISREPEYITQIMSAIIWPNDENGKYIYNPCLKDSSSLTALLEKNPFGFISYGRCQDKLAYCVSIVRLMVNYFDLDGISLEFASPFELSDHGGQKFDIIFSNLPAITPRNMKRLNTHQQEEIARKNKQKQIQNMLSRNFNIDENSFTNDDELQRSIKTLAEKMDLDTEDIIRFEGEYADLNNSEYLFLLNLLESLNDFGLMVLSMSQSFLFKNTLQKLRKYLTYEMNCIDAVISIPDELSRPKRSEVIVVFKKKRNYDNVQFIDLSCDFNLKPSANASKGMFRKNLIFDKTTLDKLLSTYHSRKPVEKFSNVVGLDEIARNDFNLSISRYVDTFEGEFIRFEDLKNEKREITSKIKELDKKIDLMMDDLGLRL